MLSSLVFAAVVAPAAPVPPGAALAPTGPAPWVLWLKADPAGRVWAHVYRVQPVKVMQAVAETVDGKTVVKHVETEVHQTVVQRLDMAAAGVAYATADGRPVAAAEVVRRAQNGVAVLASADGKAVGKGWLRAADPDAVVATAADLAGAVRVAPSVAPAPAAPRLVLLGTDADGAVRAPYNPNPDGPPAGAAVRRAVVDRELVGGPPSAVPAEPPPTRPPADLSFEAFDRDGTRVGRADVLARLRAGGLVLVAGDGRAPDPAYRQLFRPDVLALASADLVIPPAVAGARSQVVGGLVVPAPAVAAAVVRVQAGGVVKRVAPAAKADGPAVAPPPRAANP